MNRSVVIERADIGGAVVVMNRNDYSRETRRQLQNGMNSRRLSHDPTAAYQELKSLVRSFPLTTKK